MIDLLGELAILTTEIEDRVCTGALPTMEEIDRARALASSLRLWSDLPAFGRDVLDQVDVNMAKLESLVLREAS